MRVISRKTLRAFWEQPGNRDAEQPLKAWCKFVGDADWVNSQDVKADYKTASFLKGNRVCFNIGGNKYRLIVRFDYPSRIAFIRFVGSHEEYNRIDANSV